MPFIEEDIRREIDRELVKLWDLLVPPGVALDDVKGYVNYAFFKILMSLARRFGVNYANLSAIEAIPRDVAEAFHDFVVYPYERRKMNANGVVEPFE